MLERWPGKDHASADGAHADPVRGGAVSMASRQTFARAARFG